MSFQLIWWRHPSLIANWLLSPSKLMVSGLSSSLNFVNRVWTVSDLYADSSINCSKNYPERVWKNSWRSCAASMHFTFSINIKATSSLPVVWPLSKLPSPMSFFDLSTPRSVPPLFEHIHYKNKTAICHFDCFYFPSCQVRPNAISLVDAFNYTDHYLGSVLGRYDGNVYPKLYEEAWKDPLNESVVPDGYHEYIRPLLKQQLRNSRL